MNTLHRVLQKATHSLLVNWVSIGINIPSVFASTLPIISLNRILTQVTYSPPNVGAPGSPQDPSSPGKGGRPGCPENARLVSFSPVTNWGETVSDRPIFLLYSSVGSSSAEFSLWDEKSLEKLYSFPMAIDPKPGLFKFRLPDDAPQLEIDRLYRWQFHVSCTSLNQEQGFNVDGVIVRRSNPELQAKIESATPEERVDLYAENGFWFDTLDELVKLRCAAPGNADLAADWASLLEHPIVQLNEFVEEPIICD